MTKKIAAIGFDWGGVIFVTPGRPFSEMAAETAGVSLEEFNRAYFLHNHLHNKGTHSYEEMSIEILKALGKEDRIEAYRTFLNNLPSPQVDQRMLQLVRLLKEKGFKVGLLSNNSIKGADEARKIDLDSLFDTVIFSAEIGVMKPEPEAFLELARRLNVNITELAYIDDAEKSLSRASEIGYEPILYTGFAELLEQLKTLNVISDEGITIPDRGY
jgi:HAD superfamily hydrolase (TIGR01509 family)